MFSRAVLEENMGTYTYCYQKYLKMPYKGWFICRRFLRGTFYYRVKLGHIFLNVKIVSKSYGILIQRETPRKKKNIRREQMVRHISNACL